jgi:predicted phage terminase large subunit-like protein
VERGQCSPANLDAVIRTTTHADPPRTRVREGQEPGSAGKSVVAARTKDIPGYDYAGKPETGPKTTRWRPFAAQAEAGNVRLVRGPWNRAYLDELKMVPNAKHDDQADASATAFAEVALQPKRGGGTILVGGR